MSRLRFFILFIFSLFSISCQKYQPSVGSVNGAQNPNVRQCDSKSNFSRSTYFSEAFSIHDTGVRSVSLANDPRVGDQRHLPNLEALASWRIFYDSTKGIKRDIIVAVIDNGVDIGHEDLKNQIWKNVGEMVNGIDDDQNGFVDDINGYNFLANSNNIIPTEVYYGSDHGTHIAGLIAAESNTVGTVGVAPQNVKIMPLVVYGKNDQLKAANLDAAIHYAVDNGAEIINMSLASYQKSDSTLLAIQYAIQKGVVLATAASNESLDLDQGAIVYPAMFSRDSPGLMSVASLDAVTSSLTWFSNYGPMNVEIGAPGSNGILSTSQNNTYSVHEGTSMATPFVSAAAALTKIFIWSRTGKNPTPAQVEDAIKTSSRKPEILITKIQNGQQLDFKTLAIYLDQAYPYNPQLVLPPWTPVAPPVIDPTPEPPTTPPLDPCTL